MKKIIKEVLPDCDVQCFGSFHTKLYLPNSDIDVVVVNESSSDKTMFRKVEEQLFKRSDIYENINPIKNAKVGFSSLSKNRRGTPK